MAKSKPYKDYKDSGVAWLGQIPSHWKQTYIKGVTNTYSEKGKPEAELLSVYRDYGVIKKKSRDDNHNKPGMDLSGYKVVYPNTLVLNKMKTWSGSLGVSNYLGIVSPAYITCNIDLEQVDTEYLNYLLRCKNYVFEYNRLSYGVRPSQWDMRYQDFKSIPIYLPTPEEQTTIARFLDYKLAKINRFIRKKKQLIKLLNEQKAAIINQAVTKGLDPNAKTNSVENLWINELPLNYSLESFNKNVFLKHGFQFREEHFSSDGIQVVKITQLSPDGKLRLENASYVPEDYKNTFQDIIIKEGDILMALTGGTIGKIIRADINNQILLQNYRVGNFYPTNNKLDKDFLYWQLKSEFIQAQMKFFIRETGQPNIGKGDFRKINLIIPPLSDQLEIVNFISEQANRIETTISTIEKEIALVEEYKTALIAEAVTGKIDVRGYSLNYDLNDEMNTMMEDSEDLMDDVIDEASDLEDSATY